MVNCEFKKNYLNLILCVVFFIIAIALVVLLIAKDAFGALTGAVFGVAGYYFGRFFIAKKQYLKLTNEAFSANVVTYKNGKMTKIDTKATFIISTQANGKLLVLKNERNEDLTIYNVKDVKKAAEDINNLINSLSNPKED